MFGSTNAATNADSDLGSAIMGDGVIDGQGASWWAGGDPRPRLVQLGLHDSNTRADNFTAYRITLQNSAKMTLFGIGNNVTVWDVKISNPADSPNTDGIDPSAPEPRATSSRYDASHALTMTLDNVVPDPTTMDRTITRNWSPAVIGGDAPYNCVGKFVSLARELSAQSGTAIAGQPVRITAVLQTVHNPAVQPTGSIKLLDDGTPIATQPYAGRLTYLTIPNVPIGAHTYTAEYSGDSTYPPQDFGSLTVVGT